MKRLQPITKPPELAINTSPEVFLTLVRDFLDVFIVFFTNKDPQNPVPINPGDDNEPDPES